MTHKRFWLGILVIVLVFGMAVVGCDDGSSNSGPQWIVVTGEDAEPFTGTLSNNNTTITITDWYDLTWTFTKNGNGGSSLDGVWDGNYTQRMTISGNNWTVAVLNDVNTGNYRDWVKGTLIQNGTTVTFTPTHIMEEDSGGGSGGSGVVVEKSDTKIP
jgi:hypothetical protein